VNLQEKYAIRFPGGQISDSEFPAESTTIFPPIMGISVRIRSGADGDDGDGVDDNGDDGDSDDGDGDDADGDGIGDGNDSTRSA
jgi:hypothetical protein